MSDEQTQQAETDDPSGPGWRDVGPDEVLQVGDMFWLMDHWEATQNVGTKSFRYGNGYRRRIEPPQTSDSKPETMEELRDWVATLTLELMAERDSGMIALRSQHRLGREAAAEALQTWLRPVIELVAEHPEDCSSLAVAVLGYLPSIASRLIED